MQPASQGVPVTRAIGYRDRLFLRDAVTPAIFIDARTLGKPLCCRILDSAFQTIWGLLALLDIDLPPDVQLEWIGGRDVPGRSGWRLFAHCSTVVLWGRFRGPNVSPGADHPPARDQEGEDDSPPAEREGLDDGGCWANPPFCAAAVRDRSRSPATSSHRRRANQHGLVDTGAKLDGTQCALPGTRPIPTPCRSGGVGACSISAHALTADLHTLLEQADRSLALANIGAFLTGSPLAVAPSPTLLHARIAGAESDVRQPQVSDGPLCNDGPLRFGALELGFTRADIRRFLCTPAKLSSFNEALAICPVSERAWLCDHAPTFQIFIWVRCCVLH